MLAPFTIHQPTSVQEASRLLSEFGADAAIYAGGTELLVVLKERLAEIPHLIDIKRIAELRSIWFDPESLTLHIGSLTTHREIEKSPLILEHVPALADLAARVANVRVRSAGTIGGNLCFADPHSDPATLLVALEANLTLESADTSREVPMQSFIAGFMSTERRHEEVLTRISIPATEERVGMAYERIKLHERPTAAVAAAITTRDGAIASVKIVAGAVGVRPQRLRQVETALRGVTGSVDVAPLIGAMIAEEVETSGDAFESEAYKRQLARAVGIKAIEAAVSRSVAPPGARHAA